MKKKFHLNLSPVSSNIGTLSQPVTGRQQYRYSISTCHRSAAISVLHLNLSPVSSNIAALYQKLYKQSKSAPEDGHIEQIQIDQ